MSSEITKWDTNQRDKVIREREPVCKKFKNREKTKSSAKRSSASNFDVVEERRLTTRLFWQGGWGHRCSATGHNLIHRAPLTPSQWSPLICTCDRFTGLFRVGDFYTVRPGWEPWTGVLALLLKGGEGEKYERRPVNPVSSAQRSSSGPLTKWLRRWITSRNRVGLSCMGLVKIWRR